jgi:hypothetical protein
MMQDQAWRAAIEPDPGVLEVGFVRTGGRAKKCAIVILFRTAQDRDATAARLRYEVH